MKRTLMLLMLMAVAVLALAAGQGSQTQPDHMGAMMMMNNRDDCPIDMKDTDVAVLDTPTGVVLTLTTQPEKVADLQRHVERMSAMHPTHMNETMMRDRMMPEMMPGTVKYEAIENGARLTLTPKDPAKLTEFQTQVRARVEVMKKGNCSMMQNMMQGMMNGMTGRMGGRQ
jgi:hypothetical protein